MTARHARLSFQQALLTSRGLLNVPAGETAPTIQTQSTPGTSAAFSGARPACLSVRSTATRPVLPLLACGAPQPPSCTNADTPKPSLPLPRHADEGSRIRPYSGERSRLSCEDRGQIHPLAPELPAASSFRQLARLAPAANRSVPPTDSAHARATHDRSSASQHRRRDHRRPDRSQLMFSAGALL